MKQPTQPTLSPTAMQYRQTMWQVTPYNRKGKRLSQIAFLNKLERHAIKAELSFMGTVMYFREMCIKHGYPTAF